MITLDAARTPSDVDPAARDGRRRQRMSRAPWWSLGLLPVSFVAASVIAGSILAALGHDPDGDADPTVTQAAIAGIPATIVLIAPCLLAVALANRALAAGVRSARDARTVALVVGAALIAVNLFGLLVPLVASATQIGSI